MTATSASTPTLPLEPAPCPLCGVDDGEPVAVGTDFDFGTSPDSFLALACHRCGLVYLNPAPAPAARAQVYPPGYFGAWETEPGRRREGETAARRAVACCRGLPANARLLVLSAGSPLPLAALRRAAPAGWQLEAASPHTAVIDAGRAAGFTVHAGTADDLAPSAPRYDAILLLLALEHSDAPLRELRSLRARLVPGGRVVIICRNVSSGAARRFRGRHWAGYDFPRHRSLFSPKTLRLLADGAGFTVERLAPVRNARMWSRSLANFLADWSAPAWLSRQARDGAVLAAPFAAVAERVGGRGLEAGWLEAVLVKPAEDRP